MRGLQPKLLPLRSLSPTHEETSELEWIISKGSSSLCNLLPTASLLKHYADCSNSRTLGSLLHANLLSLLWYGLAGGWGGKKNWIIIIEHAFFFFFLFIYNSVLKYHMINQSENVCYNRSVFFSFAVYSSWQVSSQYSLFTSQHTRVLRVV